MTTRHHPAPEQAIGQLEHTHHTDLEAITVQMRAVSRAIEALAAAVEALAPRLPDGLPASVTERLDQARWELKHLW